MTRAGGLRLRIVTDDDLPDDDPDMVDRDDRRARAARESIASFLRNMADRLDGADPEAMPVWIDSPRVAVLVMLGPDDACIAWGGDHDLLTSSNLIDVAQCVTVAAGSSPGDVQERVAEVRRWRVETRRQQDRAAAELERTHPFVCGCGKRCKTRGGLTNHQTSRHG